MARLVFTRSMSTLDLFDKQGALVATYAAANFVDSRAKGVWPLGVFHFDHYNPHLGDGPEGAYGANGIFIFDVPGREGMGVHSGRRDVPDGRGRRSYQHCTMGCIRTTDEGTARIMALHATDPIETVTVKTEAA